MRANQKKSQLTGQKDIAIHRASSGAKIPMSDDEHFMTWKYQNVFSGFLTN